MNFAAALLHYDFHIPSVISYAGNNYTASYRDLNWILNKIKSIIPPETYDEVERVFKAGYPNKVDATSTRENFLPIG
eukprot:11495018-Ditylum_brightwellii.AAC.1